MSYWDTILQENSGASSQNARQLLPAGPTSTSPSPIPFPQDGGYKKLHEVRMALGIPAEGLTADEIAHSYPDWPFNLEGDSPDQYWEAILETVQLSFEEFTIGVWKNGMFLKWKFAPRKDHLKHQSVALQDAICQAIISKLIEMGHAESASTLRRCERNWAIRDLIERRVLNERRARRHKMVVEGDSSSTPGGMGTRSGGDGDV
ncbi:hypothetical protein TWF481_003003 [Arthrobotrys musiformis]|uniref:Uncharacterized protein n=1 Tax=Arthrobotrys musiformis TaxID=47236 RepID=A0AAV9VT10_9PEZI